MKGDMNIMGKTSTVAKQRWLCDNRTQIKAWVKPEIAYAFKESCKAKGVSMASELSAFMGSFVPVNVNKEKSLPVLNVTTRPQRRKALAVLIRQIELLMDAEEQYLEAIPENLRNSCRGQAAEQTVSMLNEAIDFLDGAF